MNVCDFPNKTLKLNTKLEFSCRTRPFKRRGRQFSLVCLLLIHYHRILIDMMWILLPTAEQYVDIKPQVSIVFFCCCICFDVAGGLCSALPTVWHWGALMSSFSFPPNRNSSPRATSWPPAEESLFWYRRFVSNVRLPSSSNVLCSRSSNRLFVNCRQPDGKQRSRRRAESDQKKDFSVSVSLRTNVKLGAKC